MEPTWTAQVFRYLLEKAPGRENYWLIAVNVRSKVRGKQLTEEQQG